jgi:tetratricopeptide (TPR) repeat protein
MANAAFVQPPRERLRLLSRARQLLEEKRYSEAVKALGEILQSTEDGVLPTQQGESTRFLKAEAVALIAGMPAEGRAAYQREYAAQAQRFLEEAVKAGDVGGIERVAGQYFHTPAGYEATQLLAHVHLDHNRALAAALCFERLREVPEAAKSLEPLLSFKTAAAWYWSGNPERARQTLVELKQRSPKSRLMVGRKEVPLFSQDAQALAWLATTVGERASGELADHDEWRVFRGNAARNATNVGSRPLLNPRWVIHSSYEPTVRTTIAQLKQAFADQNLTALPGLHPLVVHDGKRDLVLFRTAVNLLAVDFATGKRIWEVPVDESEESLLNLDASSR